MSKAKETAGGSPAKPLLVIVSACDFPNGLAAPYRIRMFGKAFASVGYEALGVFQYAPGVATPGQNTELAGEFDGVRFVYPLGTMKPPTSVWRMFCYKTWGLWVTLRHLRRLARERRIAVVLSYGNTFLEDYFYARLARSVGARFILEICDSPLVILNHAGGWSKRLKERVKYQLALWKDRHVLPRADHLFVITRNLFDCYRQVIAPERILLTPIIADADAFPQERPPATGPARLLWIGNFRPFEGLEFLVETVACLDRRRQDFTCEVYGVTPKHEAYAAKLRQRIEALGIGGRVRLHPAIPHRQVPALLQTADVLLIPREDSELNRSNLPTKLVDYLMSGRPVVSSRVGEIVHYAEHRRHIFYADDPSVEAFASAVEEVLSRPDRGDGLGRNGRELAKVQFDYREVGRSIARFLNAGEPRSSQSEQESISPRDE